MFTKNNKESAQDATKIPKEESYAPITHSDGLFPKIWGPSMWFSMHSISFCYPHNPTIEDKNNYKKYYEVLAEIIPCKTCRDSYKIMINNGVTKLDDDVLMDRESLTKWVYTVHEFVNKKLGVDYGISYEDVVKKYDAFSTNCNKQPKDNYPVENKSVCSININKKAVSFQIANLHDCPIIPYTIAKSFWNYAKKRGIDFDNFYILDSNGEINIDSPIWKKRNKECFEILNFMRENNISSIESDGIYEGLPTIEETQLILRLSSNLDNDQLINIIKKLPQTNLPYKKIYKLIKL